MYIFCLLSSSAQNYSKAECVKLLCNQVYVHEECTYMQTLCTVLMRTAHTHTHTASQPIRPSAL